MITDITQKDLLPVFEYYLRDIESVKIGIISHLSEFLHVCPAIQRESYLGIIPELGKGNPLNWRLRCRLGRNIGRMVWLFEVGSINAFLLPMVFEMISDSVSEVRR